MLQWHVVTPFSRMLAIVLFVGAIPALFFYLGMQYQDMKASASLMRIYEFPRLYSFSGTEANATLTESTSTVELAQ